MKRACFINLGCKVNKYEIDCMANLFKKQGYEVFTRLQDADVYVVNTCAVTQEAEKKSRQYIAKVNKTNPHAKIFICGCASERCPDQFKDKKNVVSVIGNTGKERVMEFLEKEAKEVLEQQKYYDGLKDPLKTKTRAYLKIQDGCNNFCSYCIIPYLRGRTRSRSLSDVVLEAKEIAKDNKEIILTGIDISSYKVTTEEKSKYVKEFGGETVCDLAVLMQALSDINARIGLSSFEVSIIDKDFLECLKRMPNFLPHFHLSLQSGSNRILHLMNRKYTRKDYINRAKLIYKYFPEANITTDIIVGFPTETEKDFRDSKNIVKKVKFGDLHIFPYSHRSGTVASTMPDLPNDIKKDRLHRLEKVGEKMRTRYLKRCLGKTFDLLAEDEEDGYITGYTENYVKVFLPEHKKIKNGDMVKIKAVGIKNNGILGERI